MDEMNKKIEKLSNDLYFSTAMVARFGNKSARDKCLAYVTGVLETIEFLEGKEYRQMVEHHFPSNWKDALSA